MKIINNNAISICTLKMHEQEGIETMVSFWS